ncbi:MAG: hypothetical protein RLZZ630_317 [Bacteroidota bacterium]
MRNLLPSISIALVLLLFVSCSSEMDEVTLPDPEGTLLFPIDTGLTRIYAVDSIYWDDFTGTHDTLNYLIREKIADTFNDLQGRPTQRIERFREVPGDGWIIDRVWTTNRTNTTAERTEDNLRFIKLVFPTREGVTWNGNSLNTLPAENYRITKTGSDTAAGMTFSTTATVLQGDSVGNRITRQYGLEKYAQGPGLTYRRNVSLTYNFPLTTVRSGYIYTETLIDYEPR